MSLRNGLLFFCVSLAIILNLESAGGNDEVYLRVFGSDGLWHELGGSASGGGVSGSVGASLYPTLSLDGNGNPIVAWDDSSTGDREIYLLKWTGSLWVEIGGSATSGGISNNSSRSGWPILALDRDHNPAIAWADGPVAPTNIYFHRWSGSLWDELEGSASGSGLSNSPGDTGGHSLAVDSAGNPAISWMDHGSDNWEIYFRQWTSVIWQEIGGSATVGGVSNNSGHSRISTLSLDNENNPTVA